MKLAFYFTLACTARCDHCITFAGPKVKRKMSLEQALSVVAQVAEVDGVDGIVFTGGENFMHAEELLELVRACTAHGLSSEVITNAFWAKNAAVARGILEPFRAAGLGVIRVSIDRWHLPYVAVERVHTALEAMGELGFERHLTCVIEQHNAVYKRSRVVELVSADPVGLLQNHVDDPGAINHLVHTLQEAWPPDLVTLLTTYRFARGRCVLIDDALELRELDAQWPGAAAVAERLVHTLDLVQFQFLATEGRGRVLLDQVPSKHVDDMTDTVCNSVGFSPVVNPEGDVFPCCSSWVNFDEHRIGNVADRSLAELMTQLREDPFALFMYHQGPAVMVKYLRAKGYEPSAPPRAPDEPDVPLSRLRREGGPLPDRYTHPCHLCGSLLERFSREELVEHIRAFYEEQPWRLIFTSRGFDLVQSGATPLF
jgi:hypothetical protein